MRRRALRVGIGLLGFAGLLWYAAASGLGMRPLLGFALRAAVPDGYAVEIGRATGDWRSEVRIGELTLSGPGTSVTVSELEVFFSLWPLARKRIELDRVRIVDPTVRLEPGVSDSVPSDPEPGSLRGMLTESPLGPWSLRVAELDVRGGGVTVHRPQGDWSAAALAVRAGVRVGGGPVDVTVDTITAEIDPLGPGDGHSGTMEPGRMALKARLAGRSFRLDTLLFETARSAVGGGGSVVLGSGGTSKDTVALELHARPLDLRDLPFDLPTALADDPRLRLELVVSGVPDSLHVNGEVFGPDSASIVVRARLRPDADGSVEPALLTALGFSVPRPERLAEAVPAGALRGTVMARADRLVAASSFVAAATLERSPADPAGPGLLSMPLRAEVRAVRADVLPSGSAGTTDVSAAVTAAASSGRAAPALVLPPSSWGGEGLRSLDLERAAGPVARFDVELDGRSASWALRYAHDRASAEGEGRVSWAEEGAPSVVVERLRVDRLDPSALGSDLPPATITALARGRYRGGPVDSASAEARVEVLRSTVGETAIDSLAVEGRLERGIFDGTLGGRAADLIFSTGYAVTLVDSLLSGRLRPLTVRAAGSDEPAADTTAASGPLRFLAGAVDFAWVLGGTTRRGSADAVFDSIALSTVRTGASAAQVRLVGDSVWVEGDIDVLDVLGAPAAVRVVAEGAGPQPSQVVGRARVVATRVPPPEPRANGAPPTAGVDSVTLTIEVEEPGRARIAGELRPAPGGRLSAAGDIAFAEGRTVLDLSAHGALRTASSALMGATVDSLQASGAVVLAEGARPEGSLRFKVSGGAWRDVRVDSAVVEVRSEPDAVLLDTVSVHTNVATLDGAGRLPATGADTSGIRVELELLDLSPIETLLGEGTLLSAGQARASLSAVGRLDSIAVRGSGRLGAFVAGGIRLAGLDVSGEGTVARSPEAPLAVVGARVRADLDRLGVGHVEVRRVEATVEGAPDDVRLDASAVVDDGRRGDLVVRIDPRPEQQRVRIERLDMQLDRDEWALAGPASLTYGEVSTLRDFLLRSGRQEIRAEGGVYGTDSLDVTVDVDSTDIGTVSDLLGLPGLQGWVGGRLRLSGSPAMPVGTVDVDGAFHRAGNRPAPASISLESDGRIVRADVEARDPRGGRLGLTGSLGIPERVGAPAEVASPPGIDLVLSADSFAVAWVLPFLDPAVVSGLAGRIDGRLTVTGTTEAPDLSGALALRGGGAGLQPLGVRWEGVDLFVRGAGAELRVDSAEVTAGDGTLRASGAIGIRPDFALDVDVEMASFPAIRSAQYNAVVSGEMDVSGSLGGPTVGGKLRLESLDVFLDERVGSDGLEDVTLTDEDLRMLRERFGYVPADGSQVASRSALAERLTADVVVELSRDSWLRSRANPEMAVAFTGSIEVRLRPGEGPALQGSVETIAGRGFVEQFGRRFRLREGNVTFDGPVDSTSIDLAATYTIPSRDNPDDAEATIVLQVEGTQQRLSLTLSSEPPMENADIVSYIATGRPASGSLSGGAAGSDGLVQAGAGLALGQVVSVVESAAEQSIGLDVVEIRNEGVRGATLVAGTYVSPRLYVGFSKPVSFRDGERVTVGSGGDSRLEIELEALRWLLLNLEAGSTLHLFLRARHAY